MIWLSSSPSTTNHDVLAGHPGTRCARAGRRQEFLSPGLAYRSGAGFVADVLPELSYACWEVLKVDSATSHPPRTPSGPICRFVCCRMEAEPIGEPTARPLHRAVLRPRCADECRARSTARRAVARRIRSASAGRKSPLGLLVTPPETGRPWFRSCCRTAVVGRAASLAGVATRRTYRHEDFAAPIYRFQNASTAFIRRRFSVVT